MQRHFHQVSALLAAAAVALALMGCSNERSVGEKEDAAPQLSTVVAKVKISDTAIKASVRSQLAAEGSIDSGRIDVDASNGRVSLRGTVPNSESVARAGRIAQATDGVTAVVNRLVVKS